MIKSIELTTEAQIVQFANFVIANIESYIDDVLSCERELTPLPATGNYMGKQFMDPKDIITYSVEEVILRWKSIKQHFVGRITSEGLEQFDSWIKKLEESKLLGIVTLETDDVCCVGDWLRDFHDPPEIFPELNICLEASYDEDEWNDYDSSL